MGRKHIGRKHKRGTANSRHERIGVAGYGLFYGNGVRGSTAEGTVLATPNNGIAEPPSNGRTQPVNPVAVVVVNATSEPRSAPRMPAVVPHVVDKCFYFPFLGVNSTTTDTAVFASLDMTHSEYGKLLVTMGKSKDRLPNLQSKSLLDYILVTLEFVPDDYDVLLDLKNQSMVSFILSRL